MGVKVAATSTLPKILGPSIHCALGYDAHDASCALTFISISYHRAAMAVEREEDDATGPATPFLGHRAPVPKRPALVRLYVSVVTAT